MAGEEISALERDGRNWSAYRKMLLHEADVEGLQGLFDGTEAQLLDERGTDSLWDQRNAQAMCLFAMTIPDSLFLRISHFDTAREVLLYLQSLFEKTTTTNTTTVHEAQHSDTMRVAARSRHEVRNRSRRQWEDSPSNGTRRERERTTTDQGRVEMRVRVAEKGAKSRGGVGEQEVAARRPGSRATDETTSGVSLMTPASSPVPRNDEVVLTEEPPIELEPPPRRKSDATQPIRTPHDRESSGEGRGVAMGHREAAGDEVEGRDSEMDDDEPCRAHECVNDKRSRVEMSEDKTTMATPDAPPSTPLEGEWIGKTSGGGAAWTAPEMNWPTRYSTSTRGASHDHPDSAEDAETRYSPRQPEDPGDATDDDAHHPDEPTEPPDNTESARVRGGEERVEERVSEASRGRADETAESGGTTGARTESRSDKGVPGNTKVDPEDPGGATNSCEVVEVEPGGETADGRDECVAHGDAYTEVDEEAGEQRRDAQLERESARTRRDVSIEMERGSASTLRRSTTTDEENDQCPSRDGDDVPEMPPEPPDGPARPENQPQSAELEGEWDVLPASYEVGRTGGDTDGSGVSEGDGDPRNRPKTAQSASERERERLEGRSPDDSPEGGRNDRGDPSGEAHASGASGRIEDVWKWPRKLRKASKRVSEHSERRTRVDSPRSAKESEDPGGETVAPGGVQSVQEGPRKVRDERVNETNAPSRVIGPGRHLDVQGDSEVVEGNPDRAKVVEGAGNDGKQPRTEGDQRYVETNAPGRDGGPGGHIGESVESGEVEGDRERQSDGDGIEMDREWCWTDSATSGARRDSRRVGLQPLAEVRSSRQERRQRTMAHAPRPSTPPSRYARSLSDHVDPPRRRGRLKTKSRRVSQTQARRYAHQAIRTRRGHYRIRFICCTGTWDGAEAISSRKTRRRGHWSRSRPSAHTRSSKDFSRAATCHIGQSLKRSAPLPPRVGKIPFPQSTIQFVQRYIWYLFIYFYLFCLRATTSS